MAQKLARYLDGIANSLIQEGLTAKTVVLYPEPLKNIAEIIGYKYIWGCLMR